MDLKFKPRFEPRPTEGFIYGEWGECMCCGKTDICLKMSVIGIDLDSVDVCKDCTTRVFAETYTRYREEDDQIIDSIYAIPLEDLQVLHAEMEPEEWEEWCKKHSKA